MRKKRRRADAVANHFAGPFGGLPQNPGAKFCLGVFQVEPGSVAQIGCWPDVRFFRSDLSRDRRDGDAEGGEADLEPGARRSKPVP